MKIVHVNTNDLAGGAARAAYRLHAGLLRLGHDSSMFVAHKTSNDATVKQFEPPYNFISRATRYLPKMRIKRDFAKYAATRPDGFELFTDDRNPFGRQTLMQLPDADIINLHWISGFIDYKSFFSLVPRHTKIVWTLHDMNAFTGGCHYDMGCGKQHEGCGACPQLGSNNLNDLSHRIWQHKQAIFSSVDPARLIFIALNKWMAREIQDSPLINRFQVSIIPNGLDISVFKPRDKKVARNFLGIKSDAKVVLFVSDSTTNKRKGFDMLLLALQGLLGFPNLTLLSVGRNTPNVDAKLNYMHMGHVENDRWLSQIYSASDVFVIPSLQDNLPNTVMESMACGIPVVGFDVGGIPDMVRPGISGLLAKNNDIEEIQKIIRYFLANEDLRSSMSKNCREIAVREFSMETQAKRYTEIYEVLTRQADVPYYC